ncbi:MAG: DUF87 domain-containing protein [Dehalococcoidales bacterium]|nr:DUF87 domain-containing protein [Dehalococcoidales bacterium]
MTQSNVNRILREDPLPSLVQPENFVGWVYSIDYDSALVMTNDLWKANALGVPHNCFLVAVRFDPERYSEVPEEERESILLRVIGSVKLPQDDNLIATKVDHFQRQRGNQVANGAREYDDLTLNQLQFGGLQCRVLGTFFTKEGSLRLGSDLESFSTAASLSVYRPRKNALETIVNYVDPDRLNAAQQQATQLGINRLPQPFRVGIVRYTSTARLHQRDQTEFVPVRVQPSDFLARRTAVFGMTRTGKSNTIKHLVSAVKRVADASQVPIGQIIFDINGEYANPNQQDRGAIAMVFPRDTIRYRMLRTEGFEELQTNFYIQIPEGMNIIREVLKNSRSGSTTAQDVLTFLRCTLDEPDRAEDPGEHSRWQVKVAAYQALLYKAGFPVPNGLRVRFIANANVQTIVQNTTVPNIARRQFGDVSRAGLTIEDTVAWFLAARQANRATQLLSTSGEPWIDEELRAMLNMLAQRNEGDGRINGYRVLGEVIPYHSPRRQAEVGQEIYEHLAAGRIVILDLSVGPAFLRVPLAERVARHIFNRSMEQFVAGQNPPNIMVYVEEAHNLLGKELDLLYTWPRLAKEGAKFRIGLVYSTQEVSSVHPNILANTENWFVSHLNNENEIKTLAHFYDFSDFSRSLLRAQDVGFTRIKTLSSPFVVPVQIDMFAPAATPTTTTAVAPAANSG